MNCAKSTAFIMSLLAGGACSSMIPFVCPGAMQYGMCEYCVQPALLLLLLLPAVFCCR